MKDDNCEKIIKGKHKKKILLSIHFIIIYPKVNLIVFIYLQHAEHYYGKLRDGE